MTKQQSMAWSHTGSTNRLSKVRRTLSARKVLITVFWNANGILLVKFMERGKTINSVVYCNILRKLKRAIQNKRRGLLTYGVVLLLDISSPLDNALRMQDLMRQFKGGVINHPPYNPDLATSDYHLFTAVKKWRGV